MCINIDAKALYSALSKSIAGKATLPVLSHALLTTEDGVLNVTTTDLEKWVTSRVALDNPSSHFQCLPNAARLKASLTGLDGKVSLEEKNGQLNIKSGRRRYKVATLEAGDFPGAAGENGTVIDADPAELATAMQAVEYAAGRKDVRYYFNGVYLDTDAVVATDGHRLAYIPLDTGIESGIIIPIASVKPVISALQQEGASIKLMGKSALHIASKDGCLITKLIDGRYPYWRNAVTDIDQISCKSTFLANDAKSALQRVAPFNNESKKLPFVSFVPKDGGIEIIAESRISNDQAKDWLDAEIGEGLSEVKINPGYLLDALGGEKVTWYSGNVKKAQAFVRDGEQGVHYIMPHG